MHFGCSVQYATNLWTNQHFLLLFSTTSSPNISRLSLHFLPFSVSDSSSVFVLFCRHCPDPSPPNPPNLQTNPHEIHEIQLFCGHQIAPPEVSNMMLDKANWTVSWQSNQMHANANTCLERPSKSQPGDLRHWPSGINRKSAIVCQSTCEM